MNNLSLRIEPIFQFFRFFIKTISASSTEVEIITNQIHKFEFKYPIIRGNRNHGSCTVSISQIMGYTAAAILRDFDPISMKVNNVFEIRLCLKSNASNKIEVGPKYFKENDSMKVVLKAFNSLLNEIEENLPKERLKFTDTDMTNATTLLNISIGAVKIVDNYKPLSTEGKYEALLLNVLIANIDLQEKYGDSTNYLKTEEEFMRLIAKLAIEVEIIDKIGDLASFINNRMVFYHEELSNIYNGNYIPGKIYDAFYLNPLSDNPQAHYDLETILVFQKPLLKMISETKEKTNSSIFSL